jgi:hypothetical protein
MFKNAPRADANRCRYQQMRMPTDFWQMPADFWQMPADFWQMPADLLAGASNKARAGR